MRLLGYINFNKVFLELLSRMMVGMKSMFSLAFVLPHHMNTELTAARTEHLLLRVVLIPTLAMEMICCFMASD